MNISDPEFCSAVDAAVRSTTFNVSQVHELEQSLDRKAPFDHTHEVDEISGLEPIIDHHISQCMLTMNQVIGLNDAIENAFAVGSEIRHVVPEAQGTFIPNRILNINIPSADVSIVKIMAVGYDVATGDAFSSTIHLTVKHMNGIVCVVGDPTTTVSSDHAVSRWKVAVVPNSAKGGIAVMVQSDPNKRVVWKVVANVT